MKDIFIFESGGGGEVVIRNNDLVTVNGYENMPFISMFGGAKGWQNDLLLLGNNRHLAQTENALNTIPLTSAGRILIEQAILLDLETFVNDIPNSTVSVSTTINKNRLDVAITINGETIYLSWNPDIKFLNYSV